MGGAVGEHGAAAALLAGEPYRAVWHTDLDGDEAAKITRQQLRVWLAAKNGIDIASFDDGQIKIGQYAVLLRVESSTPDGSRSWRWQLRETGQPGLTWLTTVTVHAPSKPRASKHSWFWIETQAMPGRSGHGVHLPRANTPGLVRSLLDVVDAHDGPAVLRSVPEVLHLTDVDHLIDVLCDPDRWLPTIVASPHPRDDFAEWRDIVTSATRYLAGVASVYLLDKTAAQAFNASMPSSHGVWGGALRTYLREVDPSTDDDGLRHRILSARRLRDDPRAAARVLTRMPQRFSASAPLPQALSQLRLNLKLASELSSAKPVPTPPSVTTPSVQEAIDLTGQLQAAEQLLDEAEAVQIAQQTEIADLKERLQTVTDDLSNTSARLHQVEARARAYRSRLTAENRFAEASEIAEAAPEPDLPADFQEIYLRVNELPNIELTCDVDRLLELDDKAEAAVWAQVTWRALSALNDYSQALQSGTFRGPFNEWCKDAENGRVIEPGKIATSESSLLKANKTMTRERSFAVPREVDQTGRTLMEHHIRLGGSPSYPRMYFYDDSRKTGKVYIGYIGEHLRNFQSRSR